jgi:hypothetical protein
MTRGEADAGGSGRIVTIAAAAASFTAVCAECVELDVAEGSTGSTFAGRLDLDLGHGTFLCRRGHSVRVARAEPAGERVAGAAA